MCNVRILRAIIALGFVFAVSAVQPAWAAMNSTNYMVNEVQIGSGSSLHDCSTNYCAKTSVGDTVVGSSSSTNYSAQFGFNTTDEPMLEVQTSAGVHDLGVLDVSTTAYTSANLSVRSYLSNGYVIQVTGATPSQGQHNLAALTTPTTSHAGAEQFGMNVVNNTSPDVGADPVQVPNGTFSFGAASSDYATPDLFKYVDGDIVAQSLTSSGETDYTLSMIVNISNVTPGGQYSGTFSAVVVPVF